MTPSTGSPTTVGADGSAAHAAHTPHTAHTGPQPADPRFRLGWKNGSSTFLVALASLMMANLAPHILSTLGTLGYGVIEGGNILTWALFASAIVGLTSARFTAGPLRRPLAAAGLVIATIAFTAGTFIADPTLAAIALITGGAGVGTAISTSGAAIAALRNPNRAAAASGLTNRVLISIVLAIIPVLGVSQLSVFGTLALISLIALALTMWLPGTPAHAAPVDVTSTLKIAAPRRITVAGIAVLFVFALWGTSEDAIWTMAPVLGGALGIGEQALGFTLSLAAAGGILGMLIVTIAGDRIGRALPLTVALVLGGIIKIAIGLTADPLVLSALIIAVNTVYAFAFTLFISTAAGLDARGRWSGPLIGAYLVGSSFAPILGGVFIEWFGAPTFTLIMGLVSFAAIVPTVLIARVSVGAERALARYPQAA